MNLPRISIRRPVLATMMNLALILFGVVSLARLPVRELPDIDPPVVTVSTIYPGASAEVVETEVTERLEEAINGIEGIGRLTSENREQLSRITVEFNLNREVDLAAQDVRDRVSRARGSLPRDVEEPVVAKQDADARPVLWVALFGEGFSTLELTTFAENVLKDRLQTVAGVSSVIFGGAKRFAMRVRLDAERMAAHQITVLDVERALREQNVELPSGRVESLDREMAIQTRGELRSPEEFNNLVLRHDGDTLVKLRDVGTAEVGVEDERSVARYNAQPAVGMGIVRQSKANTIAVADGIKEELERLKPLLPEGVRTFIAYDESIFVRKAINEVWETLAVAFVLVVLTIFIFLRSPRSTFIPAVAIPVSAVATFAILAVMGFSVNILTMLALVLAIGLVVDDSIVVLENIHRHIEEGMPPLEAAFKSMDEIVFAVIATTLALAAVFIPLAFQTSETGRLFIEFAIALSGSVLISAFVALTLTPTLSARLLRPIRKEGHGRLFNAIEGFFNRLTAQYVRSLAWSLDHPKSLLFLTALSIAAGLGFFLRLEREFLPEEDKGRLIAVAIAPEGSTSEYTDRMVRQMETLVSDVPEVAGYFSAVALSRGGPGEANRGFMFLRLHEERDRKIQQIVGGPGGLGARLFSEVEGATAIPIVPKAIGGGFGQPFQLVVQHPDLDELGRFADELTGALRTEGYLRNVRSAFDRNKPELRIRVDRDRANVLGVSIQDLSRTLQILFGGQELSRIKSGGKQYDVIVQLAREARMSPGDLEKLYVRNRAGRLVQLSNLVSWQEGTGPNAINHFNRLRSAAIEATPADIPLGAAIERTERLLAERLPSSFRYDWDGEARDLKRSQSETVLVILLALLIVYMVLAAQFESLIHPLTVMMAMPLAAIGAFGGLWLLAAVAQWDRHLTQLAMMPDAPVWAGLLARWLPGPPGMNINLFSQIGIVLLLGLVTKNSILLVEFANQRVAQGMSPRHAMIEAGRIRLRPILMTALATIMGILPIAVGFGAGAESRRPMGVAAVGGMITSTFLTLVVIPVLYVLLARLTIRQRRSQPAPATPPPLPSPTAETASG